MAQFSDCSMYDFDKMIAYYLCNKAKFTKEQAIEKAIKELNFKNVEVKTAYVKYGYHSNTDDERVLGYYFTLEKTKNSCECWIVQKLKGENI